MSEQDNDKGGCGDAFGKCCGGGCHSAEAPKQAPAPAEGESCCAENSCCPPAKSEQPPAPPACGCA